MQVNACGFTCQKTAFSCIGAAWILYLAGYHLSLPVWTGLIALVGLLYLDLAWTAAARVGLLRDGHDVTEPIV